MSELLQHRIGLPRAGRGFVVDERTNGGDVPVGAPTLDFREANLETLGMPQFLANHDDEPMIRVKGRPSITGCAHACIYVGQSRVDGGSIDADSALQETVAINAARAAATRALSPPTSSLPACGWPPTGRVGTSRPPGSLPRAASPRTAGARTRWNQIGVRHSRRNAKFTERWN
jgi:hypothetical protein